MTLTSWLSPTSAWRLVQCPAALPQAPGTGWRGEQSAPDTDAGSLAHEAVRQWVDAGEWGTDATGRLLQAAFDEAAAGAGVAVTGIERGVLTRARLGTLTRVLREALAGRAAGSVHCEVDMADEELMLRGRADLLFTGTDSQILDLKTGRAGQGRVTDQAKFQLLVYAHLFRVVHGLLPDKLAVLSLGHGRLEVPVKPADVSAALAAITRARARAGGAPAPNQETCRFCPRRMDCEGHWQVPAELRPDSFAGRVLEVTKASTGAWGIRLSGDTSVWVTQLAAVQLPSGTAIGDEVRLTGLRRPRHKEGTEWRATSRTRVRVVG